MPLSHTGRAVGAVIAIGAGLVAASSPQSHATPAHPARESARSVASGSVPALAEGAPAGREGLGGRAGAEPSRG